MSIRCCRRELAFGCGSLSLFVVCLFLGLLVVVHYIMFVFAILVCGLVSLRCFVSSLFKVLCYVCRCVLLVIVVVRCLSFVVVFSLFVVMCCWLFIVAWRLLSCCLLPIRRSCSSLVWLFVVVVFCVVCCVLLLVVARCVWLSARATAVC